MAGQPGCTVCGAQDTATVDGINGRRCGDHPPTFSADKAVELAVNGKPGAAVSYCRIDWSDGAR